MTTLRELYIHNQEKIRQGVFRDPTAENAMGAACDFVDYLFQQYRECNVLQPKVLRVAGMLKSQIKAAVRVALSVTNIEAKPIKTAVCSFGESRPNMGRFLSVFIILMLYSVLSLALILERSWIYFSLIQSLTIAEIGRCLLWRMLEARKRRSIENSTIPGVAKVSVSLLLSNLLDAILDADEILLEVESTEEHPSQIACLNLRGSVTAKEDLIGKNAIKHKRKSTKRRRSYK